MNVGNEIRSLKEKFNEVWKLLISMRASGGGGTHGLLSNTHNDTTTAAAQRGDIVYSDANNSWKRLAKGTSGQVLQGDGTDTKWGAIPAHASRHQSGGADAIKLDDLAAPDNNTDLDVSITVHGLCPKAPNDTTKYLRGDGSWQVPASSGGASIIEIQVFGG